MTRRASITAIVICGLAWLAQIPAGAVEVEDVRWGFAGGLVPGCTQPFTVTLRNPDATPAEVELTLKCIVPWMMTADAALVESVYLSPGAVHRVQFYPYYEGNTEAWTLTWGSRPDESLELTTPENIAGAHVVIEDPRLRRAGHADLASFPEHLFPPAVQALDGLAAVVLDHVPDWDERRQRALRHWVIRGGTAHVLCGVDGEPPRFAGALSFLNGGEAETRIGLGNVKRHSIRLHEATPARIGWPTSADTPGAGATSMPGPPGYGYDVASTSVVFDQLRRLTTPDHNWTLLYTLTVAYMLVMVPASLIVSRRLRDYRVSMLFLVAGVVIFSIFFFLIGRRGADEASRLCDFTYALWLEDDAYDLTQWDHCFVTNHGQYRFHRESEFDIYRVPSDRYPLPTRIANGAGATLAMAMPLYSSRSFLRRAEGRTAPLVKRILTSPEGPTQLEQLTLEVGAGFPPNPERIWAVGTSLVAWEMKLEGAVLSVVGIAGDLSPPSTGAERWQSFQAEPPPPRHAGRATWQSELYRQLGAHLVWTFWLSQERQLDLPRLYDCDACTHLFVLAPTPAEFQLDFGDAGAMGYTLYHAVLDLDAE